MQRIIGPSGLIKDTSFLSFLISPVESDWFGSTLLYYRSWLQTKNNHIKTFKRKWTWTGQLWNVVRMVRGGNVIWPRSNPTTRQTLFWAKQLLLKGISEMQECEINSCKSVLFVTNSERRNKLWGQCLICPNSSTGSNQRKTRLYLKTLFKKANQVKPHGTYLIKLEETRGNWLKLSEWGLSWIPSRRLSATLVLWLKKSCCSDERSSWRSGHSNSSWLKKGSSPNKPVKAACWDIILSWTQVGPAKCQLSCCNFPLSGLKSVISGKVWSLRAGRVFFSLFVFYRAVWDIAQDSPPLNSPAVPLPPFDQTIFTPWAHCCLLAWASEVRNALQLMKRLKTAHGHILFVLCSHCIGFIVCVKSKKIITHFWCRNVRISGLMATRCDGEMSFVGSLFNNYLFIFIQTWLKVNFTSSEKQNCV